MKSIEEDYVSFEVAKLLKEKGFDVPCNCYGAYNGVNLTYRLCITDKYTNWNKHTDKFIISCPTLQMVMKWLREVYKIHIQIWILEEKGYWFNIEKILNAQYKHKSLYSSGLEDIYFETYEQAAESAIKYWLKNEEYI